MGNICEILAIKTLGNLHKYVFYVLCIDCNATKRNRKTATGRLNTKGYDQKSVYH